MSVSDGVYDVLAHLKGLVLSSILSYRGEVGPEAPLEGDVLADLQARAASTLLALEVVDPAFDTFQLTKLIVARVEKLPVAWEEVGARLASLSLAQQTPALERVLLDLLRSPAFSHMKAALLAEIEEVVTSTLARVGTGGGLIAALPEVVPTTAPRPSPHSSTVMGFDDLVYITAGPSLAGLEPILEAAQSPDPVVSFPVL